MAAINRDRGWLGSMLTGFNPVIGWLALLRLTGALGFAITLPFLSLYLHEELGVSMTKVGLMLTAAGTLGALASTLGGALSDRLGRRRLFIYLMATRALSFLVMGYIVWRMLPFQTFGVVYIISAILGGSLFSLMDAMVSDVTSNRDRVDSFSRMRAAGNLGWAFGPALGGVLVIAGYHVLFVCTTFILLFAVLIAATRLKETWKPGKEASTGLNLGVLLNDRALLRFLLVCLALFLVRGQLFSTVSIHASGNVGLVKSQIGMLFFLNGIIVVVAQIPMTRLTKRFKPLSVMSLGGLIYGAGYLVVGVASSMSAMILGMVIVTTAEIMEAPTAVAYVSRLAPEGKTGLYMGSFGLVMHLGWTIGPLLGGILLDVMPTPIGVWIVISGLALTATMGFRLLEWFDPEKPGEMA